jgi:serine/threonine protein kinase
MKYYQNRITLTERDNQVIEEDNFVEYDGMKYYLKYIDEENKYSKGGNSSVFILYNKDNDIEKVIKISNYPKPIRGTSEKRIRRHGRFINEINALNNLKEDDYLSGYIMEIEFDSELRIGDYSFPYYVMEKADSDLKEFLLGHGNVLDDQERYKLCNDMFNAIKKLHYQGYYHRDIKPDNIFMFREGDGENTSYSWKLGDLGLIADRNKDYDYLGERIGPFGWISPEAMNKYLTERYNLGFDCIINEKSDIFQLGALFWFIFNKNAPIGIIYRTNFSNKNADFFDLINIMLSHDKGSRFSLIELEDVLLPICRSVGI